MVQAENTGSSIWCSGVPACIPQNQPSLWPDDDLQILLERHQPHHCFLGISSEREIADGLSNPPVHVASFRKRKYRCESRLMPSLHLQIKSSSEPTFWCQEPEMGKGGISWLSWWSKMAITSHHRGCFRGQHKSEASDHGSLMWSQHVFPRMAVLGS